MAESLGSSKSLRAGLRAAGKPDRWDIEKRKVERGYSPHDVKIHCVQNTAWQRTRLSMKGVDTVDKLMILETWWDNNFIRADEIREDYARTVEGAQSLAEKRASALEWATEIQVGNYLGALRRGGQLDNDNLIRKAI